MLVAWGAPDRPRGGAAARRADAAGLRRARGLHRALDHLVDRARRLLARGQPHLRLRRDVRRRARARADRARPLGGGPQRHLARLPARLRVGAADQDLPRRARRRRDLRAPARALRLLERGRADGRARACRRCCGWPRAAPATRPPTRSPGPRSGCCSPASCCPTRAARCWRCCSASASGSPPCRCGCAACCRCSPPRAVSGPVIAWAFARDALTTDNVPLAARVDAGHELGTLLVLIACLLLVAGLAVNFATTRRLASPRTRRLAGRGLIGGAGADPGRAAARARRRAGRRRRPGLRRLDEAHRPEGGDADQHARPPARDLLGARALLARVVDDLSRTRPTSAPARARTRPRARATATAPRPSATPTATGSRRSPTSAASGVAISLRGEPCCGSSPR